MGFTFDDKQRDEWAGAVAAALAASAQAVRARMAAKLERRSLPDDESGVYHPGWWTEELDGTARPVFGQVADDASQVFLDGTGLTVDDDTRRSALTDLVAATLAVLYSRGDVVADRVGALLDEGSKAGWGPDRLADELGLSEAGQSGPLSDALMDAFGTGVSTTLTAGAASVTAEAAGASGTKTWFCSFVPASRDDHMEADGQTVPVGEPFDIGGSPGMFPGDPDLPVEQTVNCLCFLDYDVEDPAQLVASEETDRDAGMSVRPDVSQLATPEPPTLFVDTQKGSVNKMSTWSTANTAPVTGTWVTRAAGAYANDSIIVTVEPSPTEKTALAVPGGEAPADLHVTVLYLPVDPTDVDARQAISAVLAKAASTVSPIAGQVSGLGWFDTPDAMTLALIDAPGLANLRAALHQALADAGYPADDTHDFEPHLTLAYAPADAVDKVGLPVTFTEFRLRWGNETLVYDLLGVEQPPPVPPADEEDPETPVPAPPTQEEAPTVAQPTVPTATADPGHYVDGPAPPDPGDVPGVSPETAPTPEATVPGINDDGILDEVAQRIVDQAATDTGVEPDAGEVADVEEDIEELLAYLLDELVEELGEPDEAETDTPPEAAAPMPAGPPAMTSVRQRLALVAKRRRTLAAAPVVDPETVPAEPAGIEYDLEGILTVEDTLSGDGRMIAAGSLTWRDLPVPLMLQTVNEDGHKGSEFCGWIHEIERSGTAIVGRMTLVGAAGDRVREILEDPKGAGRYGISVDIDSVQVVFTDPNGEELDDEQIADAMFGEPVDMIETLVAGRLMGATLCPFPAFQEAQVHLISPVDAPDVALAAAATVAPVGSIWRSSMPWTFTTDRTVATVALVASAGVTDHEAPPAEWFALQPMEEPQPFTVFPDGRCYGLVAQWGTCHIGDSSRCINVPTSNDFRSFYTGKKVLTREGKLVPTGPVIMDTVHPNLMARASDAQAFYAHTGCAVADVALYTNHHGIVACGALRPDADPLAVRRLRASDISPDWRPIDGQHKLVALLAVNASGFLVEGIAASAGRFRPYGLIDSTSDRLGALVAAGAVRRPAASHVAARIESLTAEVTDLRRRLDEFDAERVVSLAAQRTARAEAALERLNLRRVCADCA